MPVCAGQVITDEPGIYVAGRFGVRIENCLLCVPSRTTDFGRFLAFEPLTMCPYDRTLIVQEMLTAEELSWLNAYHRMVCDRLMPLLADETEKAWLRAATRPL